MASSLVNESPPNQRRIGSTVAPMQKDSTWPLDMSDMMDEFDAYEEVLQEHVQELFDQALEEAGAGT